MIPDHSAPRPSRDYVRSEMSGLGKVRDFSRIRFQPPANKDNPSRDSDISYSEQSFSQGEFTLGHANIESKCTGVRRTSRVLPPKGTQCQPVKDVHLDVNSDTLCAAISQPEKLFCAN